MLNKQVNDPDVAGVGQFVEENFFNLGLNDHPLQALNRAVRNDPNYLDEGRREITFRDEDAFKFRTLTLRQLKDAKFFFHGGSFKSIKDVVRYFNDGVPQNTVAAASGTLTPRFTHPRGAGSPRGLGLSDQQVHDLSNFIEYGLYDPSFVHFDPASTTDTIKLNERDVKYSVYRPDLAALGAIDGRPGSGRPQDNDDALSRRDMGLEFLDVTSQVAITPSNAKHSGWHGIDLYKITNNGASVIDTHLLVIAQGLPQGMRLLNASGTTSDGEPYRRVFLRGGELKPGKSMFVALRFSGRAEERQANYSLKLLSGQGNP
jgi:hypothetical protein